ncbi:MAG: ABC transporter permease [Deltaproteobacteria bacterium]|nr:ABC transporter permease [Deltaproteobacteria bacterium]
MLRYFCKTVSAHWRTNPVLYGLTVLGVALGVASVISIRILNQSAVASFAAGVRTIGGAADVVVTGKAGTLPDAFYPLVRGTPGVAAAWPVFETTVAVEGQSDMFVRLLGIDLLAPSPDFWDALSGLPPETELGVAARRRGWAAATPELAAAMGWSIGDRVKVRDGAQVRELHVGALVDFQRWGAGGNRRALVMDIADAQSMFGGAGILHRIGVEAAEGSDLAALAALIEDRLGGRVDAATPSERTGQARQLLGAFRLNLTALSMVSLLVGTFLVFSSMRACLVWQRREFGVLRSLGSTPAQVLALILGEAALLGVLGVAIGIVAGYWTAIWNLDAVSSTLTNVYMLREIESLEVTGGTLALAVFAGLGGALSGTLLPALDVWRRDTRTLLDTYPAQSAGTARARVLFRIGLALMAGALAWYWLAGWRWRPSGFVLSTVVMLCLPLLAPWLVQRLTARVRVPDFGFRYGVRSLGATLANTSFSVSSLSMAVCLLVGITLLVGSFRETLVRWVDRSLTADVFVTATVAARPGPEATLSEDVVERLGRGRDVVSVAPLRRLLLPVEGGRVAVVGVDLRRPAARRRLALLSGVDAAARALREGGVLIGEPLSRNASLGVGDKLEIEGPEGAVRLPVSGIYRDYTQGGSVTMDLGLMAEKLGAGPLTSVALVLRPGANAEAAAAAIASRYPAGSLRVRSNRGLKEEILHVFDQTFAVTRILQVMSLIIAACAITLTLLVVAQEKASEIALYRTLGAFRRQVFLLFLSKGTAMAFLGLTLGFSGGIGLGAILIFVIQKSYFGWSIEWTWPWLPLAGEAVAIVVAAVLASLYPAFKASRTPANELCHADA